MKEYMSLLGLRVKDKVTGFTGVVTSVSFDLYGCVQVIIHPGLGEKPGTLGDMQWFDWKRVEVLDKKPVMQVPNWVINPTASIRVGDERGAERNPLPSQ